MKHILLTIVQKVGIFLALLLILFAVSLGALRLSLPLLNEHPQKIKAYISHAIHMPIDFETVSIGWLGMGPTIDLQNVRILTEKKVPLLRFNHIRLQFDLLLNLWHRQIQPTRFVLIGSAIRLEQDAKKNWLLNEVPLRALQELTKSENTFPISTWEWQDISLVVQSNVPKLGWYIADFQFDVEPMAADGLEVIVKQLKSIVNYPAFFNYPIPLDKLQGVFQLQHQKENWIIDVDKLHLKSKPISLTGILKILLGPALDNPYVEASLEINAKQLNKLDVFLPTKIMPRRLQQWFEQAHMQAQKVSGKIELKGPIKDFPFDQGTGYFTASGTVKHAALQFAPEWPVVSHIEANILFRNRALRIEANQATLLNNPLTKVHVWLPRMSREVTDWLYVSGVSQTDLSHALMFLHDSPLEKNIGRALGPLKGTGEAQVSVDLKIPISREKLAIQYQGHIHLPRTQLRWPDWWILLDEVAGDLTFSENGLTGENMTALFLKKPVSINVQTQTVQSARHIQIRLRGETTIRDIEQQWMIDLHPYLSGGGKYQIMIDIPSESAHLFNISLMSDLVGVALELPGPYDKKRDQVLPSQLQLTRLEDNWWVRLNLGAAAGVSAIIDPDNQKGIVQKILIQLGEGTLPLPTREGLSIVGHLKMFDMAIWRQLMAWRHQQSRVVPTTFSTPYFDVRIDALSLLGRTWPDIRLISGSDGNARYVDVQNIDMNGRLYFYNQSQRPIKATFKYFYLTKNNGKDDNARPRDVPSLELSCDDFRYNDKKFGQLRLTLIADESVVKIKELIALSDAFTLNAIGSWRDTRGGTATHLVGQLYIRDLGKALTQWALPPVIDSKRAEIQFDFNWLGSPQSIRIAKLNGQLGLALNNGRILELDPATEAKIGIGRLISILSLQTLPQHLLTGFSDLLSSGFHFNLLKGNFQLSAGDAYTEDTYLTGNVADVSMKGNIGFAREDYDLVLQVSPHVTSGLPLVATIAGGPVAGAAVWVLNKVINEPMDQIISYTYIMKGPWQKPALQTQVPRSTTR